MKYIVISPETIPVDLYHVCSDFSSRFLEHNIHISVHVVIEQVCRQGCFLVARIPPFWPEKWVGHTKCRAIMRALLGAAVHKVHNHGY